MNNWRTATLNADTSGSSFFQRAYTDANGNIASFDEGEDYVEKYYRSSDNSIIFKKFEAPSVYLMATSEFGAPFTCDIYTSANGESFNVGATNIFGTGAQVAPGLSMRKLGNKWISLDRKYTPTRTNVYSSSNGSDWTMLTPGTTANEILLPYDLRANDRIFIDIFSGTNNGKVYFSDDAVNWNINANSFSFGTPKVDVTYFGGKYVFIGSDGFYVYIMEADGSSVVQYEFELDPDDFTTYAQCRQVEVRDGKLYFLLSYNDGGGVYYRRAYVESLPTEDYFSMTYEDISTYIMGAEYDNRKYKTSTENLSLSIIDTDGFGSYEYYVWDMFDLSDYKIYHSLSGGFEYQTMPLMFKNKTGDWYFVGATGGGTNPIYLYKLDFDTQSISSDLGGSIGYPNGYVKELGVLWKE